MLPVDFRLKSLHIVLESTISYLLLVIFQAIRHEGQGECSYICFESFPGPKKFFESTCELH